MSKIENAFKNKKAFIGFLTAGDPSADKTTEFVLSMEKAGADLIELGIPFSDPAAEGIVIQNANIRALKSGMTVNGVFEITAKIRKESDIPLVFLTYLNPVLHYGYDAFFARCKELGVDGIIIPDLPFEERSELLSIAEGYGVDLITLVSPTSEQRTQMIAKESKGFIYAVSSMGVTGVRNEIKTDLAAVVQAIRATTDTPIAVGFGINTPEQARTISGIADGVIVGSAIVKIIEEHGDNAAGYLYDYVKQMKGAR